DSSTKTVLLVWQRHRKDEFRAALQRAALRPRAHFRPLVYRRQDDLENERILQILEEALRKTDETRAPLEETSEAEPTTSPIVLPGLAVGVAFVEAGEPTNEGRLILAVTPAWDQILAACDADPAMLHR